jgi:hypothetical protein
MKFRGRSETELELEGVHRYPLAELKCVSPKRRKEMAARLGGEPGSVPRLESSRHGYFRLLFRPRA